MRKIFIRWLVVGCLVMPCSTVAFEPLYERAPIHYHDTEPDTKVTRLFADEKRMASLPAGSGKELVMALLAELDIPIESQVLVYSKTSAQNSRISPRTPRAIYFSDDVYLGWVQGGEVELASFDEELGMVFHLAKISGRDEPGPIELVRDRSCLNCHAGSSNRNLPGLMVRSVFPSDSGQPLFQAGTFHTRQDSPIEERWGGWYVDGEVEEVAHMGNRLAEETTAGEVLLQRMGEEDEFSLSDWLDGDPYPFGASSDIIALMMLEHQVGVHNVLVEANLTTRVTLQRHRDMQKAFGEPLDAPLSDTNERILDHLAEDVLEQMLFVGETTVPGGIEGREAFVAAFEAGSKHTVDGRSLRDFRLYERLMKYRCSHLIHSEAFAQLPGEIRSRILTKLYSILNLPGEWPDFGHLGESERERIHEIVSATVPGYPKSVEKTGP